MTEYCCTISLIRLRETIPSTDDPGYKAYADIHWYLKSIEIVLNEGTPKINI